MSHTRKGIFTAVAIAMSLGAAQFASGENLTAGIRTAAPSDTVGTRTTAPSDVVNRAAKTDREPVPAAQVPPTQTIAIHVDRLPSTSVVVRIQRGREAQGRTAPASLQFRSGEHKLPVACEPVVSVLAEIAKQLRPGRCLT